MEQAQWAGLATHDPSTASVHHSQHAPQQQRQNSLAGIVTYGGASGSNSSSNGNYQLDLSSPPASSARPTPSSSSTLAAAGVRYAAVHPHQQFAQQQQHQQQHVVVHTPPHTHSAASAFHSPSIASRAASMSISSPAKHNGGTNDNSTLNSRAMDYNGHYQQQLPTSAGDLDGDMPMEDADPFNKQKYSRPPGNRMSTQYLPSSPPAPQLQQQPAQQQQQQQQLHHEEPSSRAAIRYSPMNMTPSAPYIASPPQQQGYASYTPQHSARQSPTRQHQYTSPTQQRYYASPPSATRAHNSQLPPLQSTTLSPSSSYFPQSATQQLNAVFGHDTDPHKHSVPSSANPASFGHVPQFAKVHSTADLRPAVNSQPPFRRANPEGGFISPLQSLTTFLPATYRICNPVFQYESSRNPRRVLTKPSKGVKNDGYDNEDSDYILYVNDILGSEETNHKNRYLILDVLGQGTFGQVVKCQNLKTQEVVAVKVVKNKTAYFNQSMMEVSVLDLLNGRMDKNDDHHILRLKDTFIHRQHLCLVFELLSVNLYELIKQNQFRGLSTTLVRVFAQQLLNGLCLLSKAKLIHCDLKPENILLKNLESPIIKIIDFGSACDERQTVYTYIQSRFYRSPEVLLGLPYSAAIDMWSLGCIVVELFLGLPLFPGSSEYNQVSRITEMLGLPPNWMLEVGKQSGEFFEKVHDEFGRRTYRLKPMEQYSREHGTKEQPSKKYFQQTRLVDIIRSYPMPRKGMKQNEIEREMANREAFFDFVQGLLNMNPLERWSPQQARTHPFITQTKYTGPFQPQMNLKSNSRSPAPGVQQQQQAEAMSKQRAAQQQQQQQAQAQAQQAAYANMHLNPGYQSTPIVAQQQQQQQQQQQAALYQNMYSPSHQATAPQPPPPPYPSNQATAYGQQIPIIQQPPPAASLQGYGQQPALPNLYTQAATRASRQRASTMGDNGIPAALQRVVSHLDPNAPIRLQPSPAYYPPPPEGQTAADVMIGGGGNRRRASRAGNNAGASGRHGNAAGQDRNFVRMLEDRTLEEGWTGGSGWPGA